MDLVPVEQSKSRLEVWAGVFLVVIVLGGVVLVVMSTHSVAGEAQAITNARKTPGSFPVWGHQPVSFEILENYRYELPDDGIQFDPNGKRIPAFANQIPANIQALDGYPAIIRGYMVPFKVDSEGRVRRFILSSFLIQCSGAAPKMNQWVSVTLKEPLTLNDNSYDLPISIAGELKVHEEFRDGQLMSLYELKDGFAASE